MMPHWFKVCWAIGVVLLFLGCVSIVLYAALSDPRMCQ